MVSNPGVLLRLLFKSAQECTDGVCCQCALCSGVPLSAMFVFFTMMLMQGHVEAVRVRYDPSVTTYTELLKVFFATVDVTQLNRSVFNRNYGINWP